MHRLAGSPRRLLRKLRRRWRTWRQRDLIVLGSSSSEAFDYVMGRNPAYHPFWASGWSARGLRAPEMQDYIAKILAPLPRRSHVLLNFGVTDVVFNLRHKIARDGACDTEQLVREAVDGIALTVANIRAAGFTSVRPCFIAPLVPLPESYWKRPHVSMPQVPDEVTGPLYFEIYRRLSEQFDCIATFDGMSAGAEGFFMLRPEFMRRRPNHHPDYILMQDILKRRLAVLPHLPRFRKRSIRKHYSHTQIRITPLVAAGSTRPRTCR